MKKILIIFFSVFIAISFNASAQYQNLSNPDSTKNKSVKEGVVVKQKAAGNYRKRIVLGGYLGGGWSGYGGYFEISPTVSYLVTPGFHIGTRFTYIYSSTNYYGYKEHYNDYGVSVFTRYHFLKYLFAHVEFQELNFDKGALGREWTPALFIGGGFYQHVGRSYMHVGLLWNVLDNSNAEYNSPYQNPMLSVGFGVGI